MLSVSSSDTGVVRLSSWAGKNYFDIFTTSTPGASTISVALNKQFEASINATTAKSGTRATLSWATGNSGAESSEVAFTNTSFTKLNTNGWVVASPTDDDEEASSQIWVTLPKSDVTGNLVEKDESKHGIIYISSDDTNVVYSTATTMTYLNDTSDGTKEIYYARVYAKNPGKAVVTVTASDAAGTSKSFVLNVLKGRSGNSDTNKVPVYDTVILSNANKTPQGLEYRYPDNEFFDSGVTGNMAQGFVVSTNSTSLTDDEYFTITNEGKLGFVTAYAGTATGNRSVEPGTYTVTLKGTAALAYQAFGNVYVSPEKSGIVSNFRTPVTVVVTDATSVTTNLDPVTLEQGQKGIAINVDSVGTWTANSIAINDAYADVAETAGLTISGKTISASRTGTPGTYELGVTVGYTDANGKSGIGTGTLSVTLEAMTAPKASIEAYTIAQNKTVDLTTLTSWSDEISRTNTFELAAAYEGISIGSDGKTLSVTTDAATGTQKLLVNVTGTGTEEGQTVKRESKSVEFNLTVNDVDIAITAPVINIRAGEDKALAWSVTSPSGYSITSYAFADSSAAAAGLSIVNNTTLRASETATGGSFDVNLVVSNGTKSYNVTKTMTIRIGSGSDSTDVDPATPEKQGDVTPSEDLKVGYTYPSMVYDKTTKTIDNILVEWEENGVTTPLVLNTDYTVKYQGNRINVTTEGGMQLVVQGKGNYAKTVTIPFTIEPRSFEDYAGEFTAQNATLTAASDTALASARTKAANFKQSGVKVYWNGTALTVDKDFTAAFSWNDDTQKVGTYTLTGKGNFTGTMTAEVTVVDTRSVKSIGTGAIKVTTKASDIVIQKDGSANPDFTFTIGTGSAKAIMTKTGTDKGDSGYLDEYIDADSDGALKWYFTNNYKAGKAYLTVETEGGSVKINGVEYAGTKTQTFTIKSDSKFVFKKDGTGNVKLADDSKDIWFDGTPKKVNLVITDQTNSDVVLEKGVDYTVAYRNNTKAGTATAAVTGIGAYAGVKCNVTYTIQKPYLSIDADAFAAALTDGKLAYSKGGAKFTDDQIASFVVLKNGTSDEAVVSTYAPKLGTDYTVTYAKNTKVGNTDATITINPKGSIQKGINNTNKGTFAVGKRTLTADDVFVKRIEVKYNANTIGKANFLTSKKPTLVDNLTGKNLVAGRDFTFEYDATDLDDFATKYAEQGYIDVSVTIKNQSTSSDFTVESEFELPVAIHIYAQDTTTKLKANTSRDTYFAVNPYTYDGTAKTPGVITYADYQSGSEGIASQVYAVDGTPSFEIVPGSYKNNIKKGNGTVQVQGTGKYGGTVTVKYQINQAAISDSAK